MEREEALRLIKQEVKTKNLIKHMLAVEAVNAAVLPKSWARMKSSGP